MKKKALIADRLYYLTAALYLVGWGFFTMFTPRHVGWPDTLPLFGYSAGCLTLSLLAIRWLKQKNDRLSMYDQDMGLYSERFFLNALNLEYNKSSRHELPLSVMVFSFEELKETASQLDTSVEEIQKMLIDTVAVTIRNSDVLSSLNDDKFSILLPSTDVDGARVAATRLKSAIAAELKKQRLGQRAIMPFGICGTSANVKTSQDILDGSIRAYDTALHSPRNKIVTCYDGL